MIAKLVVQFDSCRHTKDGGGKVTFEFDMTQLDEIQKIVAWANHGQMNLALAVSPLNEFSDHHGENENTEF